jgi:hypothetical protein
MTEHTTPAKSAADVHKSDARSDAEKTAGPRAESSGRGDVHPLTGKSLGYNAGPGKENYVAGHYVTDQVNSLDHFNR